MKKIFKILISLYLIVCCVAPSFAAVGANDGSAFVTKAEFDAIVNTFNEQMDNYENSLVSKIDGAIANYLAGLSNVQLLPQKNLTLDYMQALGISNIYPVRELKCEEDYAYKNEVMNVLTYVYYPFSVADKTDNRGYNGYGSGIHYFGKINKNKLGETAANRLKRCYLKVTDGKVSGLIRNIQCNIVTTLLAGNLDYTYWGISFATHRIKTKLKSGMTTVTSDITTGLYQWDGVYIKWAVDLRGGNIGEEIPDDQWHSVEWKFENNKIGVMSDVGRYSYAGTNDNALVSQVCKFNTGGAYIKSEDYEASKMNIERSSTLMNYNMVDIYSNINASAVSSKRNIFNGKPTATAISSANMKTSALDAAGVDGYIYSGVPLFKASETGKATVAINIANADLGNIYITDNDIGFANSNGALDNSINITVDNVARGTKWTTNNGDNGSHTIVFDADKNKTYWIKYIPNADGPNYNIESIVIEADI